jgi:hypothetical protein
VSDPQWEPSRREVGLVALQAAVLTRRIFLPAVGRGELTPEQWQIVIALALIDSAPTPYEDPSASLESLTVTLSLDRDHAHELLFGLMTAELVEADTEDDETRFRLSARGWEAAGAYVDRAGMFLPGWPPEHRR